MDVIYRGRGKGKSTELIKRSVETNAYIIVSTMQRAHSLKRQAKELGYPEMLFPVTIDEYLQYRFRGSYVRHVLLDDADLILQRIFSDVTIDAISLTDLSDEDM